MDTQNVSLFDYMEEKTSSNKIDVIKMDFVTAESVTWQELFEGFDDLKAITYSSGINFVYNLFDMFENIEVIFGCERVINNSIEEILAYQTTLIEQLRKKASKNKSSIFDRIENNSIRLYVSRKKISHEKIYLLSSKNGRKRVVWGSANMSYNAFNGMQRENIGYMDGDKAYDWYLNVFEQLKVDSVDDISNKAIELGDESENFDEIPFSKMVKAKGLIVLDSVNTEEDKEQAQFVFRMDQLKTQFKNIIPADKKEGKYFVDTTSIIKARRIAVDNANKEKVKREEYPQLIVDIDKKKVSLNDIDYDLNPSEDEIKSDIACFYRYMAGYDNFHGDAKEMKNSYYRFVNWYFCSPFMATMRDLAVKHNQQILPYPVFGLLYGKSKAGKTSFLLTLLKMMIGQNPRISASEFTKTSIEALKRVSKGAPIIVDDMVNRRFNEHAVEVIKNDDFGVAEHLYNYPAVVISANEDVKAVSPEVVRRTIICKVEAGLTNTELMKNNIVKSTQSKIGTALYREYLRRMFLGIDDLINAIQDENTEAAPDILKYSSEVLYEVFNEHSDQIPDFVKKLDLDDYFSEKVTGRNAIKIIRDAWNTNKKAFDINKKNNELKYNIGEPHDAERLLKELPETLEAKRSRETIIMKLDVAKDYFDIDFKKRLFEK